MTKLRQRMIDDMQLYGLSERTQECYVTSVKRLAQYYRCSPDKLNQENIRRFFLHLIKEQKIARSTVSMYLSGIKFFYEKTLKQNWEILNLIKPKKTVKLPVILTINEVKEILNHVRILSHRICLTMIYSCGLRISEGINLQVPDIDKNRMLVRVRKGKGNKDRYVPLPKKTLTKLQEYWQIKKPYPFLFPSRESKKVTRGTIFLVFKAALKESGIKKNAHVHSLRHSFATHLLENDVSVRLIQDVLGHKSPRTTALYTQLTSKAKTQLSISINDLVDYL